MKVTAVFKCNEVVLQGLTFVMFLFFYNDLTLKTVYQYIKDTQSLLSLCTTWQWFVPIPRGLTKWFCFVPQFITSLPHWTKQEALCHC